MIFFRLAFLYMCGSICGWVIELLFRRFISLKKWINPGFLNGPYLPMYGAGTVFLYGACFIPVPQWGLVLLLMVALTLLEYVTGLIFIKGMKIKLWDYSDRWGNIQASSARCFLCFGGLSPHCLSIFFLNRCICSGMGIAKLWMIFVVGAFYGVFFVDLCISFNVSFKIRKVAAQLKEAVHYEQLKVAINERRAASRQRRRFLFPFAGAL